ncbi:Metallophos domain-containing protein [Psidium guajava]|nr:Metallophos domain-containing protein [Psidium guajava]
MIDFLLSLPSADHHQTHVLLTGNHDLGFAAFVGAVPGDAEAFREGWKAHESREESEGWYGGEGYENMRSLRRRWAGKMKDRFNRAQGTEFKGSIFNAARTFESYGVAHGSAGVMVIRLWSFSYA